MDKKTSAEKINEILEKEKEEFWRKRKEESPIVKIEKAREIQRIEFERERDKRWEELIRKMPKKKEKKRFQYY